MRLLRRFASLAMTKHGMTLAGTTKQGMMKMRILFNKRFTNALDQAWAFIDKTGIELNK